jgi:taurine dioxygenase
LFATNFGLDRFGPDARRRFDEEFPPRQHPVVIRHPETGRKALFVNPSYTTRIVGMTRSESRMLLQFLFRHLITPAFLFRHHWSVDDLIVWDERSTVHLAPTDFQPRRRRLIRVAAGCTVPSR